MSPLHNKGKAARELAGPAVTLSFIVASLATLASGLCYAELAARIPVSGSAYSYAYATLGEGAENKNVQVLESQKFLSIYIMISYIARVN